MEMDLESGNQVWVIGKTVRGEEVGVGGRWVLLRYIKLPQVSVVKVRSVCSNNQLAKTSRVVYLSK